MKRLRFFASVLATTALAGCALVIDLGDEPKLAPSTDGGVDPQDTGVTDGGSLDSAVDDTSTTDTGPADTGPQFQCGLPPSTNAKCDECIVAKCCPTNIACAGDPKCVEGLECIKNCLVQPNCVNKCLADFPQVNPTAQCSAFDCPQCTPGPQCADLGACVFNLPQDEILRTVQRGRILDLDEAVCKTARQQIASNGEADAGACFKP